MRNPIRLKNLRLRFLPFYVIGLTLLVLFPPPASGFALAAVPLIAGLALRSWGAGHLVKNDVLTMTGPYAHLRHPLYAGTILVATGFAVLFGGWLGVLLIGALWPWFALSYFPRKDRIESARLESRYGEVYKRYREVVPALWPRWTSRPHLPVCNATTDGRWRLERYSDNNELGTLIAVIVAVAVLWIRTVWAIE